MHANKHVSLIVAMTPERVIGRDNGLPWHLSADLQHFKATTMGKPIVMGRNTYESIGRALPGRQNIVVTRNKTFSADGVTVAHSLDAAVRAAGDVPEVMIIGGAELYTAAMPLADRLYLTHIQTSIPGDTFFPNVDWEQWRMVQRSATQYSDGISFLFAQYKARS